MSDLNLSPPERRNMLLPALGATLLLAAAVLLAIHFAPPRNAKLRITNTRTWASHFVLKTETDLVGRDTPQDDFYVLTTVHIDNPLKIPVFLKDFTATLTTADGEPIDTSAAEKNDLPTLYTAFPALQRLSSPPLLRETTIAPGQSAEGMVLLHFPITPDVWKKRKGATLTIATYHQAPQTIAIPPEAAGQ